jgi:hypothetical protein
LLAKKAMGTPRVSKKSGGLVERLGAPNPSVGAAVSLAARKKAGDEFAAKMLPIIDAIRARGITTLAGIAASSRGRNGRWPAVPRAGR